MIIFIYEYTVFIEYVKNGVKTGKKMDMYKYSNKRGKIKWKREFCRH
jgi:hypothetical protein